jgi:two-component system, cell cycle sensor histidine kinase and response regulator CckA
MTRKRLAETPWVVPALFLLLAIALSALGWRYYQHAALHARQDAQDDLSPVALGALILAAGFSGLYLFERQRAAFVRRQRPDAIEREGALFQQSIVRDLSEHEQAEARFRRMIETTQEGVLLVDSSARISYANRRMAEMLGCTEEELPGTLLFDHLDERFRAKAIHSFERRKQGAKDNFDVQFVRKDGTRCWGMVSATPVTDAQGRFEGSFSMVNDITERKQAEEALAQSEHRYRILADAAFEGIAVSDGGVFIDANEQLAALLGCPRSELVGMPVLECVHPDHRGRVADVIRAGESATYEFSLLRRDGTTVPVEARAGAAQLGDRRVRVSAIRDLSERKRAEEELEQTGVRLLQAQKMEAVGRLAGGIAHDFNNLLMVVLSYSELALRQVGEASPAAEMLNAIRAAVDQAKALTQQILAFSRRQVLTLRRLDPNADVAAAVKMLGRVIGEDIQIETRLAREPGYVRADRAQLQQVLLNLAINARDAMPKGGTLTLETADVVLDEAAARMLHGARPGRYVVIRVRDTGVGMDAATVGRLFEPFFTTKELGRGTGLGLATVYGIVKQHGGYIEVESAPGAGAAFTIYLPRVGEGPDTSEALLSEAVGGGDETVMLVEDHELVREATSLQLADSGYRVLCAPSGAAAIEMARGHEGRIDLLLTDVVMPGMNGRELFARLAAERPGLKVLLMSGYTGDLPAGTDANPEPELPLVQKPVGIAELKRRIREVLQGMVPEEGVEPSRPLRGSGF